MGAIQQVHILLSSLNEDVVCCDLQSAIHFGNLNNFHNYKPSNNKVCTAYLTIAD